jgi:hypothetical protein
MSPHAAKVYAAADPALRQQRVGLRYVTRNPHGSAQEHKRHAHAGQDSSLRGCALLAGDFSKLGGA